MTRIRLTIDAKPEGAPGQVPQVNAAGTALEYATPTVVLPLLADDASGAAVTNEAGVEWLIPD